MSITSEQECQALHAAASSLFQALNLISYWVQPHCDFSSSNCDIQCMDLDAQVYSLCQQAVWEAAPVILSRSHPEWSSAQLASVISDKDFRVLIHFLRCAGRERAALAAAVLCDCGGVHGYTLRHLLAAFEVLLAAAHTHTCYQCQWYDSLMAQLVSTHATPLYQVSHTADNSCSWSSCNSSDLHRT